MSISKERVLELARDFGKFENDTGSVEVQVAILTDKINYLTEHLKTHKKDFSARRGLLMLVGKRKNLLKYLQRNSDSRYKQLIAKLGIRK